MLAGMTRTGKTTTAREIVKKYLAHYPGLRVVIFDPKDVGDYDSLRTIPGIKVTHIRSKVAPDIPKLPGISVWHPKRAGWGEFETWFNRINDDPKPLLTVVDEPARLAKRLDSWSFPPSFVVLNKEGAGQLHALLTLVQEVAGGARQIAGQATHTLQFRLEDEYDKRMMARRFSRARKAGHITSEEPEHWHGFYHARVDMLDHAREYTSHRTFL